MEPVPAKKNRFRELAELLPETVFEMDLSGRISYFNPAGIAKFGYKRKDYAIGASFFDLIISEEHARARENIVRAIAGMRAYQSEHTCLRKDGTNFPGLYYATVKYQADQPIGILGIIIDNTHQKQL